MCGIVGIFSLTRQISDSSEVQLRFQRLLKAAESRGREASGVVWETASEITLLKAPEPASHLMRRQVYHDVWKCLRYEDREALQAVMGHSRLTTHGTELLNHNNQPVQRHGFTLIHNGIVTNLQQLWELVNDQPGTELDTEILPALLYHLGGGETMQVEKALAQMHNLVQGTVSIAFIHRAAGMAWLYSNHGSLYWALIDNGTAAAFASESRFLKSALSLDSASIHQVTQNQMVCIDLASGSTIQRSPQMDGPAAQVVPPRQEVAISPADWEADRVPFHDQTPLLFCPQGWSRFEIAWESIQRLRRCSKGVLPETMPFIEFDAQGVSNYARHHVPYQPKGEEALQQLVKHHLQCHGKRCLVAFSGGRDSSFALQYLKDSGMDPVAYTYDWGMITDLARRNQARICGALGIEHIIVSADIRAKRKNIRKNVQAWLKRPHLGTVPLFMAGDKQYFYYANQLKKAYSLNWVVLAANPLERTYFKSGFAGVPPSFDVRPNALGRIRLLTYYGREFLLNPAFINCSLFDTAGAFLSYYAIEHDYLRIFDYLRWDEQLIDARLTKRFDWEHATDTQTTWRIGDGTAAFYNYIFMQVAGFTENDSLRHNQTLEGIISREQALQLVARDNQPRFESIEWYCRTIGLNPVEVLEHICSIPKYYATT